MLPRPDVNLVECWADDTIGSDYVVGQVSVGPMVRPPPGELRPVAREDNELGADETQGSTRQGFVDQGFRLKVQVRPASSARLGRMKCTPIAPALGPLTHGVPCTNPSFIVVLTSRELRGGDAYLMDER